MARKRQPSREEIEQEAAAELNRSLRGSLGPQQSRGMPPARSQPPSSWGHEEGPDDSGYGGPVDRLSVTEEEEAVTELAIQQMAERWGGQRSLEDHVISRVNPSQAEDARDRALRQAIANQSRFAKPARRVPAPQPETRGFSSSWASSSPVAETSAPMVWESAVPEDNVSSRAAAKKEPAKRKAPAKTKAPGKKAPARKVAPAKKAPARKATPAKKAPAKKAPTKKTPARKTSPAKKTPARKTSPAKKAPAKKASPAKKAPAKKAPAKKAPAKKAPARRASPAKKAPAKKRTAKKSAPSRKRSAR